ncbi:MAG: hypothetical protein BGO11_12475 [Solirubrobacterales bacterium 70-9]|nr:MAG: hypothetical protein BGO11_12475 [Solirubrobacterales bacterium 70-9]
MVVHPGTDEADLRFGVGVPPGQRRQPLVDLGLAHPGGQVERPAQAQRAGNLLEELVDRVDADRGQHLGAVVRGG